MRTDLFGWIAVAIAIQWDGGDTCLLLVKIAGL